MCRFSLTFLVFGFSGAWGGREGNLEVQFIILNSKSHCKFFRQGRDMDNFMFLKGPRGCTAENAWNRIRVDISIILNSYGSNFLSENMQHLGLLGVRLFTKIAHHSKSSELVDCFHGVLARRTETRGSHNPGDWDDAQGSTPAWWTSGAYLKAFFGTSIWNKQRDFLFWWN